MLSLLSTKAPAHAGLRARPPELAAADDGIAARLSALCGEGAVRRLASNLTPPSSHYLLERSGAPPIFIKLLPQAEVARQVAANRFARHVADSGVPAATILPGFPKPFGDSLDIVGYPWIAGRFARGDETDCAAIGRLLARIHQALAAPSLAEKVRTETELRLRQLDAAAIRMRDGGPVPCYRAEEFRRLLARSGDLFGTMRDEPRQTIHGDFNHGNVLFPDDGSEPIALDYEDARISWLPPALEVAFALERFALVPTPDHAAALESGRALLAAYAGATGRPIFSGRGALAEILRMLALRSLTQLAMAAENGVPAASTEWDKFYFLHDQAEARADLLAEVEAPHLASR